jgi:periplasmic protein TonB
LGDEKLNIMDIAITGPAFFLWVLTITLFIVGSTLLFKFYMAKKRQYLTDKYKDAKWKSPLEARTKYPSVDVFAWTGPFIRLGLALSLLIVLLAFSYTRYETQVIIPGDTEILPEEPDVIRTSPPPPTPPPPPPPPPESVEVAEEELPDDGEPVFLDQSPDDETLPEPQPDVKEVPPPPPPPQPEVEEIVRIVEQMPRFPGCEDLAGTNEEKYKCAQMKMLEFIYKHIKYPAIARENGIEGQVVLQFVVERNGEITDISVARDIGAGCGEEAKRVVEMMNSMGQKWIPGKQRGRAVRVQFTLPVRFRLE